MSDGMLLSSGTFSHKAVSGMRCLAGVSTVALLAMAPALWSGEASAQAAPGGTAAVQLDTLSVQGSGNGSGGGNGGGVTAANSYVVPRSMSGTKTNATLREIPQSVSVVTQKQLEDRGAENLADALAYSAGILASPQGRMAASTS